jgi:hypothetical protein
MIPPDRSIVRASGGLTLQQIADRLRSLAVRLASPLGVACVWSLVAVAGAEPLGTLCEASGARFVPCPLDASASCLLVADNEIGDRLFLYPVRDDRTLGAQRAIPLVARDGSPQRAKVGDIETLEVADGVVWVVGSHGRSRWRDDRPAGDAKQCRVAGGRLSIFRGSWNPETPMEVIRGARIATKKKVWRERLGAQCLSGLFDLEAGDVRGNELAAAACDAFAKHDARASADAGACASAFQIEGAAAIPSRAGVPRLWLGLRTPTLQGKALLLRVREGADELAFDGIALADLGSGRGIRDLAHAAGQLWAIAGPAGEADAGGFELRAIEADALASGARLAMRPVAKLRGQAEGLAISPGGERIVVVTDGKAGSAGVCELRSQSFDVQPD